MILLILALLIAAPLAEIYLLLLAGGAIGALPVIGLCVATAVAGGALLRIQGLAALAGAQRDMADGKVPVEAAVDGVFLVLAAPLLMLPGFVTDALGFAMLVPPLRHALARAALKRLRDSAARGETKVFITRR